MQHYPCRQNQWRNIATNSEHFYAGSHNNNNSGGITVNDKRELERLNHFYKHVSTD